VDAPVTIIEFSDFQCPYCARFWEQTLPSILSEYGDEVRFVYMHFPLAQMHPASTKEAEASECAHDQGAFWEYHDLLFQNQTELNGMFENVTTQEELDAALNTVIEILKGYAASLGLNTEQFNECLDSGEKNEEVQKDMVEAQKAVQEAGLETFGTPGFFINGIHLGGAQPFEVFQQVLDAALAEAE
jgi:protein-disulfide isomerase